MGSSMINSVPLADVLNRITPPKFSIRFLTIARPKPIPEFLVVKLGSKTRSCM